MKRRFLTLLAAAVISASSFSAPVQELIGVSVTAEAASAVSAPTASKKSGTYQSTGSLKIKLSCKTDGATIYYSTDGGSYKRYTKAISIKKNTTLKFYAKKDGKKSKTVTRTYKLSPKFTLSADGGEYSGAQTVKLTAKTSGVTFYYTLDGSKPTTKSAKYTAKGIQVSKTCKLRVLAVKDGWAKRYVSESYTIKKAEVENLLADYTKKYGYSKLNDKQRKLYKLLFDEINKHTKEIDVSALDVTKADVEKVFYTMDYDNPQLFWLASGCSVAFYGSKVYDVMPMYSKTKSEAQKLLPQIEKAARKLIGEALEYDTDFERVLYIHDAIINSTKYTLTGGEHIRDVDGPLLKGKALCEGYAKTFAYLCQSIGIETFCVEGYSDDVGHLWNMVKLDGKWYHVDVTYDDPTGSIQVCEHDYLCITEKEILSDGRYIKNPVSIPTATATKYNYYNATGKKKHDNAQEAFEDLVKRAAENFANGIYTTEVYCNKDIIKELNKLVASDLFTALEKYGCVPHGANRSALNTTYTLELF